jgi:hypothetical protein
MVSVKDDSFVVAANAGAHRGAMILPIAGNMNDELKGNRSKKFRTVIVSRVSITLLNPGHRGTTSSSKATNDRSAGAAVDSKLLIVRAITHEQERIRKESLINPCAISVHHKAVPQRLIRESTKTVQEGETRMGWAKNRSRGVDLYHARRITNSHTGIKGAAELAENKDRVGEGPVGDRAQKR